MEDSIESLQDTRANLSVILEKHEDEIFNIKDKIKYLEVKTSEIKQQIVDKKEQLDKIYNDELCKSSLDANGENSYYATIVRTTNTTPIITEYCKCNKKYMILNAGMKLSGYKKFSYIIIKSNTKIKNTQENVPTMSELKSVANKEIFDVNIPRMQYLKERIISVAKEYKNLTPNLIIPLSEPCLIGGQSNDNQLGFGWEWDWTYGIGSCTEGTYYGEMTGFSVIGIQINDYY